MHCYGENTRLPVKEINYKKKYEDLTVKINKICDILDSVGFQLQAVGRNSKINKSVVNN